MFRWFLMNTLPFLLTPDDGTGGGGGDVEHAAEDAETKTTEVETESVVDEPKNQEDTQGKGVDDTDKSDTEDDTKANSKTTTETDEDSQDSKEQDKKAGKPEEKKPDDEKKTELPKWFSQLSPDRRENEEYVKLLGDKPKTNDLADAYVDLAKRMEKAIEIPGKDASIDDIKAFFTKMGVPESEDGYKLGDVGFPKEMSGTLEKQMRSEFMRAGLTHKQADAMWKVLGKSYYTSQQLMADNKQKQVQTFDARLIAQLKDAYPVKAERERAARETVNLFNQHMQRTGLGKVYKDTGLIYSADFVMKIANDERARGGSIVNGQTSIGGQKTDGVFGDYSPEFTKAVGGK
jgi:hypothetical protein